MLSQALILILGGCALGVVQLTVGVALGMWARRRDPGDDRRRQQDVLQAQLIAQRLHKLADEMSTSAQEHRSQLDRASKLLTSDGAASGEALAELVVDVIGDIVRANQTLQSKLDTAENRLQEQSVELEAQISRSLTDPLTGLPNRRALTDRLEERMSAWNRRQEVFSLLLVDVDHFKKLNDLHGHVAGDQVLAAIGRALRGAIRREDSVARYGGEEFAVLLPNTTLEQAVRVGQKVREAVARVVVAHNGHQISVTASGGLASIVMNERAETLIQRADSALYAAKGAGRNCAFVHDGEQCRPADGLRSPGARAVDQLVDMINAPGASEEPVEEALEDQVLEFGTYLPREAISVELAQTCQELKRHVEQCAEQAEEVAPGARRQ
jgi:diguanylate cyclase